MLAKVWKKILLVVLLFACLFNVVNKIVQKKSLKEELDLSAKYIQEQRENNRIK